MQQHGTIGMRWKSSSTSASTSSWSCTVLVSKNTIWGSNNIRLSSIGNHIISDSLHTWTRIMQRAGSVGINHHPHYHAEAPVVTLYQHYQIVELCSRLSWSTNHSQIVMPTQYTNPQLDWHLITSATTIDTSIVAPPGHSKQVHPLSIQNSSTVNSRCKHRCITSSDIADWRVLPIVNLLLMHHMQSCSDAEKDWVVW